MKIYGYDVGHMTKMAAMPIYGKNHSKIFFTVTGKMAAMPIYGKNPSKFFFTGSRVLISMKLGM